MSDLLSYRDFSVISIFVAGFFAFYLYKVGHWKLWSLIGPLAFFVGAVVNAVDRLGDGCVTDYLDFFGLFKYNVADLLITLSSTFMIYMFLVHKPREVFHE